MTKWREVGVVIIAALPYAGGALSGGFFFNYSWLYYRLNPLLPGLLWNN
jgi:hypothetical protein